MYLTINKGGCDFAISSIKSLATTLSEIYWLMNTGYTRAAQACGVPLDVTLTIVC